MGNRVSIIAKNEKDTENGEIRIVHTTGNSKLKRNRARGRGGRFPDWARAVGTERYHVYKQVGGVDAEPVLVATVRETSTDVGGLPSGAHVTFYVTALNVAGESLASQTVTAVIP